MNGCREDYLAELERQKRLLESESCAVSCDAADEVVAMMHSEGVYATAELRSMDCNTPFIAIDVSKDPADALATVLRVLARNGWHRGDTREYEVNHRWCYTTKNPDVEGAIQINIYFAISGMKCRLVPCGTETKTVYRLECDA